MGLFDSKELKAARARIAELEAAMTPEMRNADMLRQQTANRKPNYRRQSPVDQYKLSCRNSVLLLHLHPPFPAYYAARPMNMQKSREQASRDFDDIQMITDDG